MQAKPESAERMTCVAAGACEEAVHELGKGAREGSSGKKQARGESRGPGNHTLSRRRHGRRRAVPITNIVIELQEGDRLRRVLGFVYPNSAPNSARSPARPPAAPVAEHHGKEENR